MMGLEERLRGVPGVADIELELGEDGLEGIRVRMAEGSDEGEVLEAIRRILVAYGIRSRRATTREQRALWPGGGGASPGDADPAPGEEDPSQGAASHLPPIGSEPPPPEEPPSPPPVPGREPEERAVVRPVEGGLEVEVWRGDRRAVRRGPSNPRGAVEAVTGALAEVRQVPMAEVVGMTLDEFDRWRVLTVVLRQPDEVPTAGAAVVHRGLADALVRAVGSALSAGV